MLLLLAFTFGNKPIFFVRVRFEFVVEEKIVFENIFGEFFSQVSFAGAQISMYFMGASFVYDAQKCTRVFCDVRCTCNTNKVEYMTLVRYDFLATGKTKS